MRIGCVQLLEGAERVHAGKTGAQGLYHAEPLKRTDTQRPRDYVDALQARELRPGLLDALDAFGERPHLRQQQHRRTGVVVAAKVDEQSLPDADGRETDQCVIDGAKRVVQLVDVEFDGAVHAAESTPSQPG